MPNTNQIADEAIKSICSQITVSGGGIIIQGHKDTILRDEENFLISELYKDDELNFQRLQERARYFYPVKDILFPLAFQGIYKKLKKENNYSYERFKELLLADLGKIRKQDIKDFDLYFPINIRTEKKINKFKLKDIEVDFIEFSKIKDKALSNDRVKQELMINNKLNIVTFLCCKISLKGRNWTYAVRRAEEIYEFVLGIIGFYETYLSYPITSIGIPKPISKLNQTYVFVFENNKYANCLHYASKVEKTSIEKFDKENVKEVNLYINRIIKSKQQELIFKLFIAYFRGLVEKNINYSFLSFWRVIEGGIQKQRSQKHWEIIEIFKSLIIELDYKTKFKLDKFYKLRNDFVHEGVANIDQYDRNGIKSFAKLLINTYLGTLYDYTTEEIKLFFYYVRRKDKIKVHLKMAKKIKSLLKKAKEDMKLRKKPEIKK